MISMCSLRSSIVTPSLRGDFGNLVVLQQPQVLGDDLLGRRALEPDVPQLQQQAFLQIARRDADRIEALHQLAAPARRRSTGHGPIAASSSNDATRYPSSSRLPMMAAPISRIERIVGLHRQLPHQVVGSERRRRERVLDRRKLLDFLRRPRTVAVVEVVAEEIFVVLVVPGVGLVRGCFGRRLLLLLARLRPAADPRSAPLRASGSRPSPG